MSKSINSIEYLALKGCEINNRIKNLQSELEEIKSQLREHACQSHSEIEDGVFTFFDPITNRICCQVRFPPSSVVVSPNNIDSLISILGSKEFDRCFTVNKTVRVIANELDSINATKAVEISQFIELRRNTPRVSFQP